MDRLDSYDIVRQAMARIRGLKSGFMTNFFLSPERTELLGAEGLLTVGGEDSYVWIAHQDVDFLHWYYLAAGIGGVRSGVEWLVDRYSEQRSVVDIVGQSAEANREMVKIFRSYGFESYENLHRMSRTVGIDSIQRLDPRVEYADRKDSEEVHALLVEYFDRYSEQIPLREEICRLGDQQRVLVLREADQVVGFAVFEIQGVTSYLRYWFSHPDHRDKKIGSALLRRFFHECRDTKRQLFWVIDSNTNAIERYRHYGFCDEMMADNILVRNITR